MQSFELNVNHQLFVQQQQLVILEFLSADEFTYIAGKFQ